MPRTRKMAAAAIPAVALQASTPAPLPAPIRVKIERDLTLRSGPEGRVSIRAK